MQLPKLFALYQDVRPAEFTMETDTCTIGRSLTCQVVVPLKFISGLHARIERIDSRYFLYDAQSANGTFVNGRQIHEAHVLKNQDLIGLSAETALLRFENPDSTAQLLRPMMTTD